MRAGGRTTRIHRLAAALFGACIALLLGGCAGLSEVTSTVNSYGQWPEGRKPGKYVFERLPSQQNRADLQDRLEAAAQPVLALAGFEQATEPQQADVSVQVSSQVQVDQRARLMDPFWGPYPYASPNGYPVPRAGVGAWWGTGYRGGLSLSMSFEPPLVRMQVGVLIRDRHHNQVLYETHAVHDRVGVVDPALYPYLFEAALKDFPRQAVNPRSVTVPVKPEAP
jgi:Domain of unknown function (DUF4136)